MGKLRKLILLIVISVGSMMLLHMIISACVSAPISISFDECMPELQSINYGVPYTDMPYKQLVYQIVGTSSEGCVMMYSGGNDVDIPAEDVVLRTICIVPPELGTVLFDVDSFSLDSDMQLSGIEEFCVPVPER